MHLARRPRRIGGSGLRLQPLQKRPDFGQLDLETRAEEEAGEIEGRAEPPSGVHAEAVDCAGPSIAPTDDPRSSIASDSLVGPRASRAQMPMGHFGELAHVGA